MLDAAFPKGALNYWKSNFLTRLSDDAIDSNDDGGLDISDALFTLNFLFDSGPQPPSPYPFPGTDPSPDGLSCAFPPSEP
jgi:hypothetical protein